MHLFSFEYCWPKNSRTWLVHLWRLKFMCVLIHIWRSETGLSPPVKHFTDRSKAVLHLWIFYVFLSCVYYAFVCVCLYVSFGHLLGKGWPLGSRMWCTCLTVSLSHSHWYPGSGVVLDWAIPDLCTLTFMMSLSDNNQANVIESFNFTERYLDYLLDIDNPGNSNISHITQVKKIK